MAERNLVELDVVSEMNEEEVLEMYGADMDDGKESVTPENHDEVVK